MDCNPPCDKNRVVKHCPSIVLLIASSALSFRFCGLKVWRIKRWCLHFAVLLKNLVAGNGFVFNHGLPTPETTTLLITLSVAGMSRLLSTSDIVRVARWMIVNTDPQQSLAFAEVVYLGYFTSNRITDIAGLIIPRGFDYEENRKWNSILSNLKPVYS